MSSSGPTASPSLASLGPALLGAPRSGPGTALFQGPVQRRVGGRGPGPACHGPSSPAPRRAEAQAGERRGPQGPAPPWAGPCDRGLGPSAATPGGLGCPGGSPGGACALVTWEGPWAAAEATVARQRGPRLAVQPRTRGGSCWAVGGWSGSRAWGWEWGVGGGEATHALQAGLPGHQEPGGALSRAEILSSGTLTPLPLRALWPWGTAPWGMGPVEVPAPDCGPCQFGEKG